MAEQVGLPESQRFSRRPESSLKRFPERATSVRLITSGPPSWGLVARSTTPSPTLNPRASSRVISRSYQSESSARATVLDGILVRIVSAPPPTSRTREGRTTACRRVYVPGRSRTVPPPRRATCPSAAWITLSSRPARSASRPSGPTVSVSRSSQSGSNLSSPSVARGSVTGGRGSSPAEADLNAVVPNADATRKPRRDKPARFMSDPFDPKFWSGWNARADARGFRPRGDPGVLDPVPTGDYRRKPSASTRQGRVQLVTWPQELQDGSQPSR